MTYRENNTSQTAHSSQTRLGRTRQGTQEPRKRDSSPPAPTHTPTGDSDEVPRLGTEKIMWFNSGPRGCPTGLGGHWAKPSEKHW